MVEICVTVLIGLPGAGKTTFCKSFLKTCDLYNLIHICYDEFIKFNPNEGNGNDYKIQRENMILRIRNCIKFIQEKHEIPSEFNRYSKYSKEIQKYVILIDDNNYYRGMRYKFLQLAKKLQISYAQFYFNCSLEFAIKQNSLRKREIVPYHVIENMNKRLEKPDATENSWEQKTLTLESDEDVDYVRIYDFLNDCLQTIECDLTAVDNKVQNCQSEIHKIDLELRKAISSHLKSLKSFDNISDIAQKLNEKRKSIIKDLKLGLIQLTTEDDVNEIINLLKS